MNLQVPGDLGRYRGHDDDWSEPVDDRFFSSDPYAARSNRQDRHSSAMYSVLRATFYSHWLSWMLEAPDKVCVVYEMSLAGTTETLQWNSLEIHFLF